MKKILNVFVSVLGIFLGLFFEIEICNSAGFGGIGLTTVFLISGIVLLSSYRILNKYLSFRGAKYFIFFILSVAISWIGFSIFFFIGLFFGLLPA
ncbi:MAG: hypothetical protein MUC39_04515 [Candidatus Omnitrophica bacterium]|jgi:hypothetical protein|nr:hypothetical protein [Candidatus Omnitrophota bacterium]